MPFDINVIWNIYKTTLEYQVAMKRFEGDSLFDLVLRYNPTYSQRVSAEMLKDVAESFYCYGFSEYDTPQDETQAHSYLTELMYFGLKEEGQWIIVPRDFDFLLGVIVPLSFAASQYSTDYFYPYLFALRLPDFISILNVLDISIPETPKRTDYESRFEYYWVFCQILGEIRTRFHLTHTETCVFVYDFLPSIHSRQDVELHEPTQCWFIGGLIAPEDIKDEATIWQVNKDTRPGDILVHYETSPISAITTIWQAQSDACIDPFFHWHCYAKIGNRVTVPHISLSELKENEYFSAFPLTKKNFQGVNGFRMESDAYQELLRMFQTKGADISLFPKLYAPDIVPNPDIVLEHDVEEWLIIPLLESLGLDGSQDYKRQMGIHIGSGHRVFPDIVVYYNEGQETAEIIIEAKLKMRNRVEFEKAFLQARSYALCMKSRLIILCDEQKLLIFEKKDSDFDKEDYKIIGWTEVCSPDVFNSLKTMILTYN